MVVVLAGFSSAGYGCVVGIVSVAALWLWLTGDCGCSIVRDEHTALCGIMIVILLLLLNWL